MRKKNNGDEKSWRAQFARWEKSGLTQHDYCRKNKIRLHLFKYWRTKLLAGTKNQTARFVAVR